MATKSSAVLNPQLEMTKQTTVHANLRQEIICTTKDKMKLMLQEYRDAVEAKQKATTWGGITLSLLLALVTSSPKDAFGLTAEVWSAIFIVAFCLGTVATLISCIKLFRTRQKRNVDDVCNKIMCGNIDTRASQILCKPQNAVQIE